MFAWAARFTFAILAASVIAAITFEHVPPRNLALEVPALQRPAATTLGWLSVSNTQVVDDRGRTILLRGFNTTSLLDWPGQPVAPLDDSDMELMQQSGFNVVRLAVAWSRLEPQRGWLDRAYLEQVAEMVERLNQHDLYVVVDVHLSLAWSPRFGGAGAPAWATLPLIPDVRWGQAGEWKEAVSPAVLAANAYFWTSPEWQADFEMIWRALADRFRNSPGIVGYDLYNEPNAAPLPPGLFEDALMWPFFIRLIDSVAQEDPNHLFIVEGPLLLTPPVLEMRPRMDHVTGGQLVYAPHVYVGSVVPPAYFDDPTAVVRHVNAQAEEARQLPAPAWWGELGVDTGKPYAVPWTDEVLDAFDDLDVGWAWWQWRQDWGWGVRNQSGDFINWDFLQHLARPFIVASPGGVQGERGDGVVGRLTIDVEADHEDLPVSVAWPTTTLPPPTALGTCLDAARFYPQQARLELLLHPGVGCTIHIAAEPSAT